MRDSGSSAVTLTGEQRSGVGRRWLPVADDAWFAVGSGPVRRPPGAPGWTERSPDGRAGDSVGVCLRPAEDGTP